MLSWVAWALYGSLSSYTHEADGEREAKRCFACLQPLQMGWELPGQAEGVSAWHWSGWMVGEGMR